MIWQLCGTFDWKFPLVQSRTVRPVLIILIQWLINDYYQFVQKFLLENGLNQVDYVWFGSYVAHLTENPAMGTALYFGEGQAPQVLDQDQVNFSTSIFNRFNHSA